PVLTQGHSVGDDGVESASASAASEDAGVVGAGGDFGALDSAVVFCVKVEFWIVGQHPAGLRPTVLLGCQAEVVASAAALGAETLRAGAVVEPRQGSVGRGHAVAAAEVHWGT